MNKKDSSQKRVDRQRKQTQEPAPKNEELVNGVNDFTKPPEYPIFSESESQSLPFDLQQTFLNAGLQHLRHDNHRLTKGFSQISDIQVSKNTLTSHFAKSNLFDLTLS